MYGLSFLNLSHSDIPQQPLRGLFLRNYLLNCLSEVLPAPETVAPAICVVNFNVAEDPLQLDDVQTSMTISDSLDFLLMNFFEMSKLWCHMGGQGKFSVGILNEQRTLQVLLGKSLDLISLQNISFEVYQNRVLPKLLKHVISSNDAVAQEFIMESVMQVFPDIYNVPCLGIFLKACAHLVKGVRIKLIIATLIDRITIFAARDSALSTEFYFFKEFSDQMTLLAESRLDFAVEDLVAAHVAIIKLAIQCPRGHADGNNGSVSAVLQGAAVLLARCGVEKLPSTSLLCLELVQMVQVVIEGHLSAAQTQELEHLKVLMALLSTETLKELAIYILETVTKKQIRCTSTPQVIAFLDLLAPFLVENSALDNALLVVDPDGFEKEQTLLSRFIALIHCGDPDVYFHINAAVAAKLIHCGDLRIKYSLPNVINAAFKLVVVYNGLQQTVRATLL